MTETLIESAILEEAQGAHGTSRKILALMEEPSSDPIEVMIGLLQRIRLDQQTILMRLEIIERRLASGG